MAKKRSAKKKYEKSIQRMWIVLCCTAALLALVAGFVYCRQEMKKRQYPLKYEDVIRVEADVNGLDPYLVCALIYAESGFRAGVESSAGAVGLMQIMPPTGRWLADMAGEPYSDDMLYEPEYNIHLGCRYLKYLFERYPGREEVLAAYNAGPNRVSEWLEEGLTAGEGDKLDVSRIPFGETKNYVYRVTNAYDVYVSLYKTIFG